eukprot:TRINITY_DN2580_c0_g1_i1.p1 TRINITY_DN2580_c0_g1~~TRINITY_DN2580_c0_g1_i1.p1  ORF type:complete len:294 (+),score=37.12 TRINITY_DN2580_c0_g1_i1:292-1173(+)
MELPVASKDLLVNTPSRLDGVNEGTETFMRISGCEVIQEAGILLKLPQVTICTAQVLFHRFYYRQSFAKYTPGSTALGSLFLATKVNETPRKLRHVVNVFHRLELRRGGKPVVLLDIADKKYWDLRQEMLTMESYILRELGFHMMMNHPHKFIFNYILILDPKLLKDKAFVQETWKFANDSMRTTACVRFRPEVVACCCIFMAARYKQVALPEEPLPWWDLFDANITEITELSRMILSLYSRPKAHDIPLNIENDEGFPAETEFLSPNPRSRSVTPLLPASGPGSRPITPILS